MGRVPVEGRRQPRAAIEQPVVATAPAPLDRRVGQPPVDAQAGPVLVDPGAQARPGADQRLVGDVQFLLAGDFIDAGGQ